MYRRFLFCWLLLSACLLVVPSVMAQQHRLLPVESWHYGYIQRLQHRGYLLELNPTLLPYRHAAVLGALGRLDLGALDERERHWVDILERSLGARRISDELLDYRLEFSAALVGADTRRYDMLRPTEDAFPVLPVLALHFYGEAGPILAQVGARHNFQYDDDPDGLSAVRRLYSRNEDTYIGFRSRLVDITLGRYSNHWATVDQPALVVSNNPRSYDHLAFRIGGPRLSITSMLGELDNISEDDLYTGEAFLPGSKRRFLAANRVDFRVSERFRLSLIESILYSGQNAQLSMRYLNPMHRAFFSVASPPVNDDVRGLIGATAWFQLGKATLFGQVLVDDIDILGHGKEPPAVAVNGSVFAADVFASAGIGGAFDVVTARTYNTHVPEGQYIFLNRGLATQFSDYIHSTVFLEAEGIGRLQGVTFRPRIHALWQGEMDIRRVPYPTTRAEAEPILDGTPERTIRGALQVAVQRSPNWWVRLDGGLNVISNEGHIRGRDRTRFVGMIEVGARIWLDGGLDLGF
jgi:hypothetical protein